MHINSNRADIPGEGKSTASAKTLLGTKCLYFRTHTHKKKNLSVSTFIKQDLIPRTKSQDKISLDLPFREVLKTKKKRS